VNDSKRERGRWQLDRSAFTALLQALHADPATAASEYERLRRRLLRFFGLHGVACSAEATDEAFNRLAKRLSEGEPVHNCEAYLAGIARLLVLEERQHRLREERLLSLWMPAAQAPADEPPQEAVMQALEAVLRELSAQSRTLLTRYYGGEGAERARERERLARELGLSINSLRNRTLRLRRKLEAAVRRHLGSPEHDIGGAGDTLIEEEE
jgi:hypothetical protein